MMMNNSIVRITPNIKSPVLNQWFDKLFNIEASLYKLCGLSSKYIPPFSYPEHTFWEMENTDTNIALLEKISQTASVAVRFGITPLSGTLFVHVDEEDSENENIKTGFTAIKVKFNPLTLTNIPLNDIQFTSAIMDHLWNIYDFDDEVSTRLTNISLDVYNKIRDDESITEEEFNKIEKEISEIEQKQAASASLKWVARPFGALNVPSFCLGNPTLNMILLEFCILPSSIGKATLALHFETSILEDEQPTSDAFRAEKFFYRVLRQNGVLLKSFPFATEVYEDEYE
jgi:hypothetical protein